MVGLCLAAWVWPKGGVWLNPGDWTKYLAIAAIFFFTGLSLRTEEVLRGFGRWRLHLFIQSFHFLLLPLACWLVLWPWRQTLPEGLLVGFYLLSVLPNTITACVIFTQLSGGDVAAALFNAVASNMAGIILSPILLLLMLGAGGTDIELDAIRIFLKLCLLVVLPFIIGQAVHWSLGGGMENWPGRAALINSFCILVIVYLVFCKTFAGGGLGISGGALVGLLVVLPPIYWLVLGLAAFGGKLFRFSRRERITILFCASQKTLALGLPLAAACLANRPDLLGLASLPIIIYHFAQLLTAGLLKDRLRSRQATAETGRSPI